MGFITEQDLKERFEKLTDDQRNKLKFVAALPTKMGSPMYEPTVNDQWLMLDVLEFIEKNYSRLEKAEIEHAFNLLATKQLLDEKNNVIRIRNSFGQKMSLDNVGEILTAYVKGIVNARVRTDKPKKTHEESVPITPAEAYDLLLQICKGEGNIIPRQIFIPIGLVHEHLKSTGAYDKWSEAKREEIKVGVIKEIERRKIGSNGPRLIGEKIANTDVNSAVKEQCVRLHLEEIGMKNANA